MNLRSWHLCGTLTLGLMALAGGSLYPLAASLQKAPVWLSDYDNAQKIARESGKSLFVAFR